MRAARVLALVLIATIVGPASHAFGASCARPRCFEVRVAVPRGVKVPNNRVRVVLPDGYARTKIRYPVVYLLHGVGDTYKSWTENTDVVAFSRRYKAIIVMPDGGSGDEAGWYSDWSDGSRHWETFHTKVLVRFIDRTFRTSGRRAIVGFSMGGFGAMSYAARHRGLYGAAATFSGAVNTMYAYPASGPAFHYGGQGFAGQSAGTPSDRVWGNQMNNENEWRRHNPTDIARRLKGVWLYISTGSGMPGGPAGDDPRRPYAYPNESFIHQMNIDFMDALDSARIRYASEVHAGHHDWPYWQRDLHRVLPKVVKAIST